MKSSRLKSLLGTALVALALFAQADVHFAVSYDGKAFAGPFTGKVIVYLSKKSEQPRLGPHWDNPEPIYSAEAVRLAANKQFIIDSNNAVGYPDLPSKLEPGDYIVQAIIDRDLGGRAPGSSPSNLMSAPVKATLDSSKDSTVNLSCDEVIQEPEFKETQHIKAVQFRSKLLSNFYHRPTYMHAVVVLPDDWASHPTQKYPVDIDIPGFGGSYMGLSGKDFTFPPNKGVSFLGVFLDPNCPTGHCVFANSDNNGPWGDALVKELLPYIAKKFRAIGQPGSWYLGGHSSGGWSSLWLQINYPDFFGGVFSTAPDPVDFHAFQNANLYASGENVYFDKQGNKEKLARLGNDKYLYFKDYAEMERPLRGEQLGSFNAVFSPKGKDGRPESVWDPNTGAVIPSVVEHWQKYDIDQKLKNDWPKLKSRLKGKIHVWVGTEDTFYLDRAVHLMADEMKKLGSDAEIGFVPGNHFTMMTAELNQRMLDEMSDAYLAWKSKHPNAER